MTLSIPDQLNSAELRINNSLSNTDIKAAVLKKGYDDQKFQEGKTLLADARTKHSRQVELEGLAQKSTEIEIAAKSDAYSIYTDISETVRGKFTSGSPVLSSLGLIGAIPRSTARFIERGYTLFDNIPTSAEVVKILSDKGYTAEVLTEGRAKIAAYQKANEDQGNAMTAAESATEERDKALKALNKWISEYTTDAKIALKNNKTLLEAIGIPVRKNNRGKKKPAAKITEVK